MPERWAARPMWAVRRHASGKPRVAGSSQARDPYLRDQFWARKPGPTPTVSEKREPHHQPTIADAKAACDRARHQRECR